MMIICILVDTASFLTFYFYFGNLNTYGFTHSPNYLLLANPNEVKDNNIKISFGPYRSAQP